MGWPDDSRARSPRQMAEERRKAMVNVLPALARLMGRAGSTKAGALEGFICLMAVGVPARGVTPA
jgi:hypothetical protein